MDFNKDETLEFKEILDSMSDNNLKNAKITKYVAAIIYAVNNDGTCNIYIPPDTKNIATNIPNKSGELLQIGDSVEVCTKNGKLNNAWIALKHGSSSTKLFDNINVANDATIGNILTVNGFINNTHVAFNGNSNSYPYHRVAYTGVRTTSWVDNSIILLLTRGYNGGDYGIIKCDLRTNNVNNGDVAQASATWLVRKGFDTDQIVLGLRNTPGNAYLDVFLKLTGYWQSTTIIPLAVGARAGFYPDVFTVCNSRESDNSVAVSEVYSSITTSTTAPRTYTTILTSTDGGVVLGANQINNTLIENTTSGQTLALPMVASTGNGMKELYNTTGLSIYHKQGTTSAPGRSELVLGNATAEGNAGNKDGTIRLFTQGTGSNYLARAENAHNNTYWNYLPAAGGTLALAPVELYNNNTGIQSKSYASISNLSNYKKLAITFTVYKNSDYSNTGGTAHICWLDLTKADSNGYARAGIVVPYSSNHLDNANISANDFKALFEANLNNNRVYCSFAYNGSVQVNANYVMTKIEGYLQ